jgi:hypothetical protein
MAKRIGILRGGKGRHYEKSLQKGGELILHIHENLRDQWKPIDILVDKEGLWHVEGVPVVPADLVHKVDVVWNVSHPNLSIILKNLAIPEVGVSAFPFLLSENRSILEEEMKKIGVRMPRHFVIPVPARPNDFGRSGGYQEDFDGERDRFILKKAKETHEKFSPPWIVKSFDPYSDLATHLAKTFSELVAAIEDGVNHGESILVEEFILGKEAQTHQVPGFREQEIYHLPSTENLSVPEKESLSVLSKKVYEHLDLEHYLNSFFVLHPKRGIFLKQLEFFPDLRKGSHFEEASGRVGSSPKQIIGHMLEKALF